MNEFLVSGNVVISLLGCIRVNHISSIYLNKDVPQVCAEPGGPPFIEGPVLVVDDDVEGNLVKEAFHGVSVGGNGDMVKVSCPNVFPCTVKMIAELVDCINELEDLPTNQIIVSVYFEHYIPWFAVVFDTEVFVK